MESEPAAPASTGGASGTPTTSNAVAMATSSSNTGNTGGGAAPSSAPSNSTSGSTAGTSNTGRQVVPQISVYSGISDRQTVQVIQQALHRQPNTAAQYLQQMYAAQQQHLMLQTAALQHHNLSTAQLQSLAAVQQASISAGRQSSTQNGTSSQQTSSSQATINLTTSPAAAQLISRAQSVSSAPASITQQAVLLGSPSSPTLTASQAQMYLRAQMAQQSNLVQVARSLGRAVPLSPQLIFTPTATVTAVQSESSTLASTQQAASCQNQVQNLAIRGQQGAATGSSQSHAPQALSLKQAPVPIQPASAMKNPGPSSQSSAAGKTGPSDGPSEAAKKGDTEVRAINMSRSVTAGGPPQLIAPAYTQIQPHSLVTQHKQQQQQQQFVMQQQQQQQNTQSSQRAQGQLLQTASIQPSQHTVHVLPKPGPHQAPVPGHQATIFHSTISPHALHASLSHAKAQPVQLTAINLQIQPTASRLVQESKDKPTSLVVRETCPTPATTHQQQQQQPTPPPPPQPSKPAERQPKVGLPLPAVPPQEGGSEKNSTTSPGTPPPAAMTSGNESEAPTVTAIAPQNGENKPPQAVVKPQVLTHVIEGFVIQEGAEPFPVCVERLPILINSPKKSDHQLSDDPDKTPLSNTANTDSEPEDMNQQDNDEEEEAKLTCEYCGWVDYAYKFKGSKRFCSVVCAKRYNVGCTKRMGLFRPERSKPTNHWRKRSQGRPSVEAKKRKSPPSPQQTQGGSVSSPHLSQPSQGESSPCSDMSSYEEPPSPLSAASSGPLAPAPTPDHRQPGRPSEPEACEVRDDAANASPQHFLPCDPTKWNVEEVYEFIRSLPGCQEIADEFRSQEIDGQALLLLKEDHLMSAMNIKLGPALKIFARINMLKDS